MKYRFIFFTRTPWHEAPRARHQLALSLSKDYEVLFIEANSFGYPKVSYKPISNKLTIIKTSWFYNYKIRYRVPILNEFFQFWIFYSVVKKYRNDYVLLNFDHTGTIISRLWNAKSIYYCNDDHTRKTIFPFLSFVFKIYEKKVASSSTLCVATAQTLVNKLKKYNSKTYLVKLGAPETVYLKQYKISLLRKNQNIKVAIVGFISSKNNFDLLVSILQTHGIELHVFGSVSSKIKNKLSFHGKVFWHGVLIGDDLYNQLSFCDVGIAPYDIRDSNTGRTPNKLWLYLAIGLPVVVTNIDNIKNWYFDKDIIYRSEHNENFVDLIFDAYKFNSKKLISERIDIAKKNSWSQRVNEIIKYLDNQ